MLSLSMILNVLVLVAGVTAMYKGADIEHMAGWPWAVLSLAAWMVATLLLRWGFLPNLAVQVGLFLVLGGVIFLRRKRPEVIK